MVPYQLYDPLADMAVTGSHGLPAVLTWVGYIVLWQSKQTGMVQNLTVDRPVCLVTLLFI